MLNADPSLWHPLLVQRWSNLAPTIESMLGCRLQVIEGYRPDRRSPHGFVLPLQTEEWPRGVPAAVALTFIVEDWDPESLQWLHLTRLLEIGAPLAQYGLVRGPAVEPLIQVRLVEWSDETRNLVV